MEGSPLGSDIVLPLHTGCGDDCICKVITIATNSSLHVPVDHSLDVDEIYQDFEKDILHSTLLNDIDLYLECDEDSLYVVPPKASQNGPQHQLLPTLVPGEEYRIKVSFPETTEQKLRERFKCDKCGKTFTRISLVKDHKARQHNESDLFTCPLCPYKGRLNCHLQKHMRRQHTNRDYGLHGKGSETCTGSLSPASYIVSETGRLLKTVCAINSKSALSSDRRKSVKSSLLTQEATENTVTVTPSSSISSDSATVVIPNSKDLNKNTFSFPSYLHDKSEDSSKQSSESRIEKQYKSRLFPTRHTQKITDSMFFTVNKEITSQLSPAYHTPPSAVEGGASVLETKVTAQPSQCLLANADVHVAASSSVSSISCQITPPVSSLSVKTSQHPIQSVQTDRFIHKQRDIQNIDKVPRSCSENIEVGVLEANHQKDTKRLKRSASKKVLETVTRPTVKDSKRLVIRVVKSQTMANQIHQERRNQTLNPNCCTKTPSPSNASESAESRIENQLEYESRLSCSDVRPAQTTCSHSVASNVIVQSSKKDVERNQELILRSAGKSSYKSLLPSDFCLKNFDLNSKIPDGCKESNASPENSYTKNYVDPSVSMVTQDEISQKTVTCVASGCHNTLATKCGNLISNGIDIQIENDKRDISLVTANTDSLGSKKVENDPDFDAEHLKNDKVALPINPPSFCNIKSNPKQKVCEIVNDTVVDAINKTESLPNSTTVLNLSRCKNISEKQTSPDQISVDTYQTEQSVSPVSPDQKKQSDNQGTNDSFTVKKIKSRKNSKIDFKCEHCQKVFKQKRCYDTHVNKHAGRLECECEVCQKKFAGKESLRKHRGTHSLDRPFICEIQYCRKTFKTNSALNEHVNTVHAEKVHKCPHSGCEKTYALKRDLKSHLVKHSGLFKCHWEGCSKTFRDQFNLDVHYRTHTGERNRTCPMCSYMCIQKNSLDVHMKNAHGINKNIYIY